VRAAHDETPPKAGKRRIEVAVENTDTPSSWSVALVVVAARLAACRRHQQHMGWCSGIGYVFADAPGVHNSHSRGPGPRPAVHCLSSTARGGNHVVVNYAYGNPVYVADAIPPRCRVVVDNEAAGKERAVPGSRTDSKPSPSSE